MNNTAFPDCVAEAVMVDYHVTGDQTASAVARGDSQLVGISLAGISVPQHRVTGDFAAAVWSLGTRRRVYRDSIFARTVERVFGLPQVDVFDDLGTMIRLLDVAGLWDSATDGRPTAWPDDGCADQVARLPTTLPARLTGAGLYDAYSRVELPVVNSIVDMTINGMPVDLDVLAQVEANTAARLDILRHQIAESTGGVVNPDHDNQIRTFLYERRGLAVPFLTPTRQRSVGDVAMQQLEAQHPVVAQIRDYRSRRNSLTMCRSLARNHCPRTGCVHGTLNPLGAATGRFSCSAPNLQGVPGIIRHAIRARDGKMLVEADISQAEYRVLAHFTCDPGLVEVFQAGNVDLHKQTMALVLGKSVDTVTPEERKDGKAVNFGIVYGQTEHGLARKLGISVAEARGFIDGFFRGRPAVRDWVESIKQQVRRRGYVQTWSGRCRNLPAIWSDNSVAVAEAERQAVNTIIQGTAADLLKLMLARLHRSLPDDFRLLLTVHDSILLEVPDNRVDEARDLVRQDMESPIPGFSIPIQVEIQIGATWAGRDSPENVVA